ncbi:MAG: oxidoreductase [Mycobacteriaceae bacterium]
MGILDRFKWRRAGGSAGRGPDAADAEHLHAWAVQHHGVEAYVEPTTPMSGLTVVLVAHDGEWTRRRVEGEHGVRRLGKDLAIPVYDVQKVGYPQRMRDHDARARILRDRARERP